MHGKAQAQLPAYHQRSLAPDTRQEGTLLPSVSPLACPAKLSQHRWGVRAALPAVAVSAKAGGEVSKPFSINCRSLVLNGRFFGNPGYKGSISGINSIFFIIFGFLLLFRVKSCLVIQLTP